jgi:NAD(P)-dependent dehydrogenase (short-subunit alcohol dehydrogenase family)
MPMSEPDSKGVLVTGASRGLGLEIALRLARGGFGVWAGIRDPLQASAIQRAGQQRGVSIEPLLLDVTDVASIDAALHAIAARGGLYGLVNNAGITGRAYFEDFPEEKIREIFEVNVFGTMNVTRRVLPVFRRAGSGRIITLTSIGGRIGTMGLAPYIATKFALEGFSESLWLEMKPFGVHVTIVEPGMVKTDIWDESRRVLAEARNPNSPYRELFTRAEALASRALNSSRLSPADVAETVFRAMTTGQPRLRYVVGKRARFVIALRRHLPGELFEKLYFGEVLRRLTRKSSREKVPATADLPVKQ